MVDELLNRPVYGVGQQDKETFLLEGLNQLTQHHARHCEPYKRLLPALPGGGAEASCVEDVPFLPVSLFKQNALKSIPEDQVFKVMTSSGTTGQQVSQVFLDTETARLQTVALSRIFTEILGPARLPMLLVESPALLKNRQRFSARVAGVLGMMNFGRKHHFCLDENMQLDEAGLLAFLEQHGQQPFLIFGFTFMAWQYLLAPLRERNIRLDQGILVHSGGWKKLEAEKVSNSEFRAAWKEHTGLQRIYNFYGMVEQVGSVYVEGEDGYLYPPNFSDIVIRDPYTFRALPPGEPGVIQVLSLLPRSYPGHSILTEDLGVIHHIDDAAGRWRGKGFSVLGRAPKVELRGCSDIHASETAS